MAQSRRMVPLIGSLVVLLVGCAPTEAELQAVDSGRCQSFGFMQGSPDFSGCMMQLTQQRIAEEAENRRVSRINDIERQRLYEFRQAREAAEKRRERESYERARANREGCERSIKPIYC